MKSTTIANIFSLAFVLMLLGACSNDETDIIEPSGPSVSTKHTCKMKFIGGVTGYDNTNKEESRAVTSSWSDGDTIYIAFFNESNIIPGEAVYNSSNGWIVTYDGELALGSDIKCEARFFVNATVNNSYLVTINPFTEIYEDVNAKYTYSDGELIVQASLIPKTGRIRFTGDPDTIINLTGITTYSTYSPGINQFTTTKNAITTTVTTSGSTPYIYGMFTNSNKNISLISSDYAYTRTCADAMLKAGESGYMAIPSKSSHNNWRTGAYISIGSYELKMLPVAGHPQGFFLMAETETTESLWHSIFDSKSESQLPVDNVTSSNIMYFISRINNHTALNFDLPTSSQWVYAAKGGDKSLNYIYAGSNIPGDVAWYAGNTSSKQPVKTKTPNELGLYDMSGNVAEFVSDEYGGYRYIYGGKYNSSTKDIMVSSNFTNNYPSDSSDNMNGVGFRLILTFP